MKEALIAGCNILEALVFSVVPISRVLAVESKALLPGSMQTGLVAEETD
jgi:hypothetical protein